jgi:trehalose-6-phosphate synthase
MVTTTRRDKETEDWVTLLRERYEGMKLLVGRDKLDFVKGVRQVCSFCKLHLLTMSTEYVAQKLLAFEKFLERHPEWDGKVWAPTLFRIAFLQTRSLTGPCLGCIDSGGSGYDGRE